jgi:hypothetical protein
VETAGIDEPGVVDVLQESTQPADETIMEAEKEEAMRQSILALFPDDQQARAIANGILTGHSGQELRGLTDLDETGYASKRRFMSRTIGKYISSRQGK